MKVQTILDRFQDTLTLEGGDPGIEVSAAGHPATSVPNAIVYISKPEDLEKASASTAVCCVCSPGLVEQAREHFTGRGRCLLSTGEVYLAMARVNMAMFRYRRNIEPFDGEAIHPTAVIHPDAELGEGVLIGPNTTIGADTRIGDRTVIGANVTVETDVQIGADCHIHPQVYIAYRCVLGDRCEVHPQSSIGTEGFGYAQDKEWNHYRIPHFGRAILEDDVHVGACVCIDRGTYDDSVIRRGTKIDNHCHFAHNHSIGEKGLFTAGFMMAGSSTIGNHFVAGGRTSVSGHLTVTDNVQTAGMSLVSKDVKEPGNYAGYPLLPHKDHLRAQALIARLPEMKKLLGVIKKKLDL